MFYTLMKKPPRLASPSGDRYANTYQIELDAQGSKHVVKSGATDLYARIQASHEMCKIENIIRRLSLGDTSMLRPAGQYIDTVGLPSSLADMQNLILAVRQEFDQLPLDIRKAFDFSAEKYVAAYGSEEWKKVVGYQDPDSGDLVNTGKEPEQNGDQ